MLKLSFVSLIQVSFCRNQPIQPPSACSLFDLEGFYLFMRLHRSFFLRNRASVGEDKEAVVDKP